MSKVPKHELESILRKLSDLEENVAEIKDKVRGLLDGSNINQTVIASPSTPKSPSAFNFNPTSSLNEKFKVYGNKTVVSVGSGVKTPAGQSPGYAKKSSSGIVGARLSAFESSSPEKGTSSRAPPPPIPPATFRKVSVKTQNSVSSSISPVASYPVNNTSSSSTAPVVASATASNIGSGGDKPKLPHISAAMKNEILQRTTATANVSSNSDSQPQVPKQFQQRVNDIDSEGEKNSDDDDWE